MNKYRNKKVIYCGEVFDSKKEAKRYAELQSLQRAGIITDLKKQVEFELIPNQYEMIPRYSTKTGRRLKDEKRLVERRVCYVADFTYIEDGNLVVEDTKSPATRTKDYIMKRKLMLYIHNIKINEI